MEDSSKTNYVYQRRRKDAGENVSIDVREHPKLVSELINYPVSVKNMKDQEPVYYVYQHRRNDTGEIFYVGIGSVKKINGCGAHYRANTAKKRSGFWTLIVKKAGGRIVEIVQTGLTRKQACDKEMELIKLYGRKDLNTGSLVNLTDGGEGGMRNLAQGVRDKLAQANRDRAILPGYVHPMRGKKHSTESLKRMSDAHRGSKQPASAIAIRTIKQTGVARANSRLILDMQTGIFYDYLLQAANALNINTNRLGAMLRGDQPNRTSLVYCNDDFNPTKHTKKGRLIFNPETGIFYESVGEAAITIGSSTKKLGDILAGRGKKGITSVFILA